MINLIKNELTKIFHKKAIYIIAIISVVFTFISTGIIYLAENLSNIAESDNYYQILEESLKSYDLNNREELNWYIDEKTNIDVHNAAKEFPTDSWQYYMISSNAYEYLNKMNVAKYLDKDDEAYNTLKEAFDEYLEQIRNNDWQYFVNQEKESILNTIAETQNELADSSLSEEERATLENNLAVSNINLEGVNYRLEKNIPYDNSNASNLVSEYVTSAIMYLDTNKDEESYINREDLINKRNTEETYYTTKYKLENNMLEDSMFQANSLLYADAATPILFIVVVIVMIAGTIVSEEFNKGTIKQLLLRPYSRFKILLSKYITCLIVFILFILFYELVSFIAYGLSLGFKSYSLPIIIYNFTTHQVMELNLIKGILMNFVSILPVYIIILTLAFFLSTLITSSGIALTISFLVYIFSDILNGLISLTNYKILRLFPTMCWNFNEYLFGNIPADKYLNFPMALIVTIITFLVLFVSSFLIFKHKDIKNQ